MQRPESQASNMECHEYRNMRWFGRNPVKQVKVVLSWPEHVKVLVQYSAKPERNRDAFLFSRLNKTYELMNWAFLLTHFIISWVFLVLRSNFFYNHFSPFMLCLYLHAGDSFRYSEHHVTCGSAPKTSTTKFARACKFSAKIKINIFSKYYVHAQGSMWI